MKKVITYGTFDLLHRGHIRLLQRAKALGNYLIVGITADDFDKARGKINVSQSLIERIESVNATGLADKIIVEEYEGQKIDDIKRYDIDIFTVGSDWEGQFDYLKKYCDVIYLDRTEGISSSELREKKQTISLGIVGSTPFLSKIKAESKFVNGLNVTGICTENIDVMPKSLQKIPLITANYDEFLNHIDAVYICSHPAMRYEHIKKAINNGKHILYEQPATVNLEKYIELKNKANSSNIIMESALKTAYATAYSRLVLMAKGGKIGKIMSVDATCTSLRDIDLSNLQYKFRNWSSLYDWGPTALLPVFQLLGTKYREKRIVSHFADKSKIYDTFSKIDFTFPDAVASIKVGKGVKSEGELIVSGTEGYIYVPAPWWKTDYFEIRYENPAFNRRYFYQLDGEGIRYELVAFAQAIKSGNASNYIEDNVSEAIVKIMEDFNNNDLTEIM